MTIIAFATALSPATADPSTDREKRRQHLPYVRASTDCIANAVGRSPNFNGAVEADSFRPLIGEAIDQCLESLSLMVRMHDQIFGMGGMDFFKGPYSADIERAVRTRLATRITSVRTELQRQNEQRQAEAAKAAAERAEADARARTAKAEKQVVAEKVRDLIRDKTMACIGKQAIPMLVTDEKAEVIAKAAMLFCESEVNALLAATLDVMVTASGEVGNEAIVRQAARKRVEEVVTAHVIRAKAELLLGGRQESARPNQSGMPTF